MLGSSWDFGNLFMRRLERASAYPDFGPVEIDDYNEFLAKSKEAFVKKWNAKETHGEAQPQLNDFHKLKLIGAGSFGKVYLVRNTMNDKYHAMKAISKQTIIKYKQLEHTKTEKQVLRCINCPFTIRADGFFKDNSYVYFVVPFVQGGELYRHLHQVERFDENCAVFYVAQVVLALEYLHHMDIIYRDLKPENILVDHTGYAKLADFGFCKQLLKGRTYTLCGTPEYLAPEVILNKGYGMAVDWWGVGILAFELAAGFTPFRDKKTIKVYERIINGNYKIPTYFSDQLKDLVRCVLQADISKRYGCLHNGVSDFKRHSWFGSLDWQLLVCRKLSAPYVPKFESRDDTRYFRHLSYESLEIEPTDKLAEHFTDF